MTIINTQSVDSISVSLDRFILCSNCLCDIYIPCKVALLVERFFG